MNKVMKLVLECNIQGYSINGLMTVINASHQPETALELILGIYAPPILPKTVDDNDKGLCNLLEFNPLNGTHDQVKFEYQTPKRIRMFYDTTKTTREEASKMFSDNEALTMYRNNLGDNYEYVYVKVKDETETSVDSVSVKRWQRMSL